MTSKNMPGFTAAAALYKTDASYRAISSTNFAGENGLRPAMSVGVHYPCWWDCQQCKPTNPAACLRCARCVGHPLSELPIFAF